MDNRARSHWIGAAGWFIVGLAAGAAALPFLGPSQAAAVIGGLLIVAGLIEIGGGMLRQQSRGLAMLAGVITVIAGLLFSTEQASQFVPKLIIISGWLFLRSLVLAAATLREGGSVRFWTGLSAAVDFILALLLFAGVSVAALIVVLFGPTQPMIAHFAWILAISFVATGTMLLEIASCARREMA